MNARDCPKQTCTGTMRHLGTSHCDGVTKTYFECATCLHYEHEETTEHEEPTLL
jgi:hypothetical protein